MTGDNENRPSLIRETPPLLMLMDGHAMVHRAWHGIQSPLTLSKTNEDVRGVYAFANTFIKAIQEWEPTHCAIAFDMSAPTFRHIQYPEYKAQRPETPDGLRAQFPWVRRLMEAFNVPIFEVEEYEADDVLGTLCRQATEQGMETIILTGDTDTLQLVSPSVRVVLSRGVQDRAIFDVAAVRERYGGLEPGQQPDVKALEGDTSDNIPGVPKVGRKTAVKLIQDFGSIEGLYAGIDSVTPPRVRDALASYEAEVRQGLELTTIVTQVPITLDSEGCRFWQYNRDQVVDLLRDLEFRSIVSRVPEGITQEGRPSQGLLMEEAPAEAGKYETVWDIDHLEAVISEMRAAGSFTFDVETTGKDAVASDLVGVSLSAASGRACYIPLGHQEGEQIPIDKALDLLKPLFEDPAIGKTAHNGNYDMTVLAGYGIWVNNFDFDTMVAAHLLGEKSLGLKNLAFTKLNHEMTPIETLIGTGRNQKTMAQVPVDQASDYASADADMTQRLKDVFQPELEREASLSEVFTGVEMPLVPVLVRMQRNGVYLEVDRLREMAVDLGERLGSLEQEVFDTVGHRFTLNSTQQLAEVLFNELRLPHTRRTKTGYSTDAAALDNLKMMVNEGRVEDADPRSLQVLDGILEYRELSKLKSTYVDSLPLLVNPQTGRVHTSYNQAGSATGRMSSNDPNLQNIPGPHGAGQAGAKGICGPGRAGVDAPGRRLLPDRASGAGAPLQGPGTAGRIPAGRGHPLGDGGPGEQRPHRRRDLGDEARGQGDELRRHLRAERLRHIPADGPGPGPGRKVHRELLQQVPGHPDIPGGGQVPGEEAGLPGDGERAASLVPGDGVVQLPHTAGRRAHGGEHAHPGHGGGHRQAGDGVHRPRNAGAGHAQQDDTPGPRRAYL